MSRSIGPDMNVGEILVRLQQEATHSRRGDLAESAKRLDARKQAAVEAREKMKKLNQEANRLAAEAAAVEQPHTFFGKLFDFGSSAEEAEEKAHAAQEKSLEAETAKVELGKERRELKDELQKMQAEMQRHDTTISDLNNLLEKSVQRAFSIVRE